MAPSKRHVGVPEPQRWASPPALAALALVLMTFLHVALDSYIPKGTFVGLLVVLLVVLVLWLDATTDRLRGAGVVEWAMVFYLAWNAYSLIAPHVYPAVAPYTGEAVPAARFIMTGTVIPFAVYVAGRYAFDRPAAVRVALWSILAIAAYSAWVSVLEFYGPKSLVWPQSIVNGWIPPEKTWVGRAVGVINQPVVNGLILVIGFAVAMFLMSQPREPTWRRFPVLVVAVGCGCGLYLTHTRAAWLSGLVMLLLGALLARGYRTGFVVAFLSTMGVVALNWSRFTSTDREGGGVGSKSEVWDRLNMARTALWGFAREPIEGWGIGRFWALNTYHHQQWSPEVPWHNGYAGPSHMNELGILAELGLIGLTLWVAVLAAIVYKLLEAYRTLPDNELCGKPLAVTGIIAMTVLLCCGFTVDLRFMEFATATVFLLAGIAIGWSDRHRLAEAASQPSGPAPRRRSHAGPP